MHTLSGGDASEWTHAELEEHLDAGGRELLRQLLQDHLDLRARREEEQIRASGRPVVMGPEGQLRPWRETGHSRWLASVFGLVRVTRVAHRGPGVYNIHPTDAALSLPAGRHSMGLRRLAVTESVRGSFDQPRRRSSAAAGRCWANADSKNWWSRCGRRRRLLRRQGPEYTFHVGWLSPRHSGRPRPSHPTLPQTA